MKMSSDFVDNSYSFQFWRTSFYWPVSLIFYGIQFPPLVLTLSHSVPQETCSVVIQEGDGSNWLHWVIEGPVTVLFETQHLPIDGSFNNSKWMEYIQQRFNALSKGKRFRMNSFTINMESLLEMRIVVSKSEKI